MKISTWFILLLSNLICVIYGKKQIPIGGIFNNENSESEIAFRYAIHRVNIHEKSFELVPIIKHVLEYDSFKTQKTICEFTSNGIAALFGPSSVSSTGIAESMCKNFQIPHIMSHYQWPETLRPVYRPNLMTFNVYPDSNLLARALSDLIVDYSWKSFTIIYENDEGLIKLKDVLQIHGPKDHPITIRQIGEEPDYRPLFKEIQKSGEGHIILDCNPDKILNILRQASEVKMLGEYQSYIITSLDTHTIDFEEIKFARSNITTLRLFDTTSFALSNIVNDWEQGEKRVHKTFHISAEHAKTESVLMNDAVHLFASAIRELHKQENISAMSIDCENLSIWPHGKAIAAFLKERKETGVSGTITFDDEGRRNYFKIEIIELSKNGLKKIATWDPLNGVNYTRSMGEVYSKIIESFHNKTFAVVSRIGAPFLMKRTPKDGEVLDGNARFEGYSLDLIDGISKILGFSYRFELVPDEKYGSYDKTTKQWNGLVKHLLDRKADFAICDLTITYERRTAVDFTMPFMTLGISILFSKPVKQPPNLFSFLSPLSLDVWIYMATAYLGVSILLFVLARMAPDDWENPHPCNQNPEEVENIWNMLNCTWLMMGSIMGQGCDILPKAVSTRLVAGMWWFFALIMLSSYTANLAAFLTMERMDVTIESAEDLAKQNKIKYGAVEGGSTLSFFKESNFSTYQRMWASMESTRPTVFTISNQEGIERVQKGKRLYAFLMESTSIEYTMERNCDLTQIGGLLDSKGYGIAMPVNSPYRTAISGAVLKMQEEGKLLYLKTKWWKKMHGGGHCKEQSTSVKDSAAELGVDNVGGVFVVLAFGCLFGLLIGTIEFLWNIKKVAIEEKSSLWDALKAELIFATNIWITTKPVHNRLSDSSSEKNSHKFRSRATSESRSTTAHVLHAASSIMHLDKLGNYFHNKN